MSRPSWSEYWLGVAKAVSARADCRRAQHGAVIVTADNRIVSMGYNGAPRGVSLSCLAGDCPRGTLSYDEVASLSSYDSGPGRCFALHAEQNAVAYGDHDRMKGGSIYVTGKPCLQCVKIICAAEITKVVYVPNKWHIYTVRQAVHLLHEYLDLP